ncbi:hypothetical protein NEOLEDRAFT_1138040 [Neolentinus lepideus HHB14362 ss-1]|uniref:THH1/TOM1/TOM3 domain-containing protein n=1 Tax=Neolentinus lepideus HHB14362 ss-1 TaxID=1314782 RepID=A0A165QFQ0_9AGAM|nr:hypothetical protein NEOLEDRAFT_1138040 [Neolentinus lepideus HHB14362 ss-1]
MSDGHDLEEAIVFSIKKINAEGGADASFAPACVEHCSFLVHPMHPVVIDYAEQFAVYSDYAAIFFALMHFLLFITNTIQLSRRRDTIIYLLTTFFSASRCITFILRLLPFYALRTLRKYSIVILNSGTSSVLYAVYTVVLKRDAATGPYPEHGLRAVASRLRRNRSLVLAALLYCIFLRFENVYSVTYSYWLMHQLDRKHKPHHKADGPLYMIISLVLVMQTCILLRHDIPRAHDRNAEHSTRRLVAHIFSTAAIAVLLFIRSMFSTVTAGIDGPSSTNTAAREALYYVFSATPELLVAALLCVKGLVPFPAGSTPYVY